MSRSRLRPSPLLAAAFLSAAYFMPNAQAAPADPSAQIDALIEKGYAAQKVTPNPMADDETFVRRVYLDIAGRIPTPDESRAFLGDPAKDKREKLIDSLLESDGYVSHFFNYWADVLRAQTRTNNNAVTGRAYIQWIKDSLRANKPYDQFVRDLVSAEGYAWDNPAIGYYMRDYNMPLDNMSNTARIFLGTRLECAQCHNHPFDKWSQMDYYKLAAFSYGMTTPNNPDVADNLRRDPAVRAMDRSEQRNVQRAFSEIYRPLRFTRAKEVERDLRLPHDYQYDDAEPKAKVEPGTIFGHEIKPAEGESNIQAYARWMTSPENPRFTTVIANRLWKKAMGVGLIEPVDDMRDSTESTNPALMAYLEKLMRESGYDMKGFLAAIFKSKTYQRGAYTKELELGEKYYYPGPLLRRMSAEQAWDSLVTLATVGPDRPNMAFEAELKQRKEAGAKIIATLNSLSPKELLNAAREVAKVAAANADQLKKIRQELEEAQKAKDFAKLKKFQQENGKLTRQLRQKASEVIFTTLEEAGKTGDMDMEEMDGMMEMMMGSGRSTGDNAELRKAREAEFNQLAEQMGAKGDKQMMRSLQNHMRERERNLLRASEIESPAPRGHFLRLFGQSDREVIENATDEASVPQALALMNGPYFSGLLSEFSPLRREVEAKESPQEKIDAIFFTMLSRPATESELSLIRTEVEGAGADAYADVAWAVLNSRHFLFIR